MNNPLCGENGSTLRLWTAKRCDRRYEKTLDEAMAHFARVTSETLENDYLNTPGAGRCRWTWLCIPCIYRRSTDTWY
ncbi:MAG: hypothetical protein ACLUIY_14360 [Dorea longicatena]